MSEEQPREPVKRIEEPKQSQEQQEAPPEQPWSVPGGPQITMPDTKFEPLRPLEPATLGEAIAESFMPEMPEFEPIFPEVIGEVEERRIPMNRPTATAMENVCPHGLAGLCIWCQRYPCDYMLKRSLRFLLTKIEYGGSAGT